MFDAVDFNSNVGKISVGVNQTFIVNVKYRQNATWQGTVTWVEEKKKASFRSLLELIKLMDSAIESTSQELDAPVFTSENENGRG